MAQLAIFEYNRLTIGDENNAIENFITFFTERLSKNTIKTFL